MVRKIKVAEFVSRLESGGVEAMLLNYLGHFSHPENFEIHIVTQDINDFRCVKQFIDAGYQVDMVTHKRTSIVKNVIDVWKLLGRERFDVVHSHMTLMNFYVLFMARLRGTQILISHSHNAFKTANPVKIIIQNMLKILSRWSANVWMACGYDAGKFMYGKKAMQLGKVLVFNNAIDVSKFAFDEDRRKSMRTKLGFCERTLVIGHVGRFMEQKNQKYLVDVFKELYRMNSNARMLMIGTGQLEGEIREYARLKGVLDLIIFVGSVPNTYDYYQAMDVFILPSKYEGLPVVSIEAQAADLPMYISDQVDKTCKISDKVTFLPITIQPKVWAEIISASPISPRSQKAIEAIRGSHYDIASEAMSLETFYRVGHV